MTNYENIKNMTIEEMTSFLAYDYNKLCVNVKECGKYHCDVCARFWLESEVKENVYTVTKPK